MVGVEFDCSQIKDNRSKLVMSTGEFIISMAKELNSEFEPVAVVIFPQCIDKVSSGISVVFGSSVSHD